MSSKTTHVAVGYAVGSVIALGTLAMDKPGALLNAAVAMIAIRAGSTAPDWMEISTWWLDVRRSVIPHRTITHWIIPWVVALLATPVLAWALDRPFAGWAVLMFVIGGLSHLALDAMTPMGIPWLHPFRQRPMR